MGAAPSARRHGRGTAAFRLRQLLPVSGGALTSALEEERERGRFFIWLPVLAICGVILFFAAPDDPSLTASALAFLAALAMCAAARKRPTGFCIAVSVAAIIGGFLAAGLQVHRVAAPVLERGVRGEAVGVVERREPRARGAVRLLIRVESIAGVPEDHRPRFARATVRGADGIAAGSRVAIDAYWRPPPQAVRPGGYDFAREAFFTGLGAVGSEAKPSRLLDPPPLTAMGRFSAATDRLRNAISARIQQVVPGDAGAISAALVTGQRGDISAAANDALRTAGLYHVISISGLHMALFGGGVFAALRLLLVMVPGLGLHVPVKKWAAAAALLGAGGYLYLSGNEVAAQRSFIMISVVFLAVIVDRQGLTMRNLAIAALFGIALTPHAVLGPSFQMSFAAVLGLVSWYERTRWQVPDDEPRSSGRGVARRVWIYVLGIVVTTIIATLTTGPFAGFHFQRIAVHSLLSNLVALPVVGTLVMPFALLGFVLMPFGLDPPAWMVMGFGVDIMLAVSYWVADLPGALVALPAFSASAVLFLALGLCWVAIWTTWLRLLGVLPVALGVALAAVPDRPDIYIDPEGRAAAVRGPDGMLHVSGLRFASFAAENWLAADGDLRKPRDKSVGLGVRCDSFGCTLPLPGEGHLALAWTYAALREDCTRARIVVTRLVAPPGCRNTAFVVDGTDLARNGATTLKGDDGGAITLRAHDPGQRAWSATNRAPVGPPWREPAVSPPPSTSPEAEQALPEGEMTPAEELE
jgi:competence protein ComEC